MSVDQVEIWWIDSAWFAIMQQWDVGADNLTLHSRHQGDELVLTTPDLDVKAGQNLTLEACTGLAGGAMGLIPMDLSGAPMFHPIMIDSFDAQGEWRLDAMIPQDMAGLSLGLAALGIMDSNELSLSETLHLNL